MQKTTPLVTVICLCYNHENYVVSALESVLIQTYEKIELIIIDDASTDKSVSVINKWNAQHKTTFIKNKTNLGPNKSFNKGLRIAKGEYIIDLAADDFLTKRSIEQRINQFINSKYKNVGVVFSNVESIDEKGNHIEYRYPIKENDKAIKKPPTGNIYREIVHSYFISSPSMLIKKEVFDKLNGYDERLSFEDLDFCIRSSRYFAYDYVDEILIKKRILKNSLESRFYNKRGKELGHSSLIICEKAYLLNENKSEHNALKNRVLHFLQLNIKIQNYRTVIGFTALLFKLQFKLLFYR